MSPKTLFILSLCACASFAAIPVKPAKTHLFILVHGEDGKKAEESKGIFDQGAYPGGLKNYLEQRYGLKGYVHSFQMGDPSASLTRWTREFGDRNDPGCWLTQARNRHKEYLRGLGLRDEEAIEKATPRQFIVFAHSFGGLVVRNYICSEWYRGDIRIAVFINSPHNGTDYPYILEVLETRDAVKRLGSMAGKALKNVSVGDKLVPGLEFLYDIVKTYDTFQDVVREISRIRSALSAAGRKVRSSRERFGQTCPGVSPQNMVRELSSLSSAFSQPVSAAFSAHDFQAVREACASLVASSSGSPFHSFFSSVQRLNLGPAATVFSTFTDQDVSAMLFSPLQFKEILKNPAPGCYGDAARAGALITTLSCPIRLLAPGNKDLFVAFDRLQLLETFSTSLNPSYASLGAIKFSGIGRNVFDGFASDPLVAGIAGAAESIGGLADLGKEGISLDNAVALCNSFFQSARTVLSLTGSDNDASFLRSFECFSTASDELDAALSDGADALAALEDLAEYRRARHLLSEFESDRAFTLATGNGLLTLQQIRSADSLMKRFPLCFQGWQESGYPPDKLETINAYIRMLADPSCRLAGLSAPLPSPGRFELPAGLQSLQKAVAIKACLSECVLAARDVADLYYDINDLKNRIVSLCEKFRDSPSSTTPASPSSADGREADEAPDALGLILMGLSVTKALGSAENAAASAAGFAATGKKIIGLFMDEVWKEIQNGALLEVGFAEAATQSVTSTPSDPAMAAMASNSGPIEGLNKAMPVYYADTALNRTKYRVVYTTGVLTPTRKGTEALDLVCGKGGTGSLARAAMAEAADKLVEKMKTRLVDEISGKINSQFSGLSAKEREILIKGAGPGGDFSKAVETAKRTGNFAAYKDLIQNMAAQVIAELNESVSTAIDGAAQAALDNVESALRSMEAVQKGSDFLDNVNAGMVVSLYQTVRAVQEEGLGIGPALFAMYYSPLLKLGLYADGDFIVPSRSAMGEGVALFEKAAEVRRLEYHIQDPLSPFAGIAGLGLALDAARFLVPDPATREGIRLTKIASVNLLSIAVAAAKYDELTRYFKEGHSQAVSGICKRGMVDNMLFEKPYVSISFPKDSSADARR